MRTINVFKNSVVTLAYQIVILALGIVIPRWIIITYGSEVNGLTSNINQIINIINLLQAGIVGASIFEMYKPITVEDYKTIGSIYYSSCRYFKKLSWLFWGLTILIIPYLLCGKTISLNAIDIILSVLILGSNAAFIFRYYCCYDVIFSAYQKKYVLILSMTLEKIVYYVLLFIVLYFQFSYIFMYIAVLVGSVSRVLYLRYKFNQCFMQLIKDYKNETNYKVRNQGKLFGNQIIQNIMETSPTIFVSSMHGLVYGSVLSIYLIIVNIFKMILSTLQNAIAASFGDLIARGDNKKTLDIFHLIQYIFTILSILFYVCMILLILPFVNLYCDGISTISYVYQILAENICMYLIFFTSFLPFNLFINSLGFYGKVLFPNILIGIISLGITFLACSLNFQYAYLGLTFFYFMNIIHRFFVLKGNGFDLGIKSIFRVFFVGILMLGCIPFIHIAFSNILSWKDWILYSIIISIIATGIVVIYTLCFEKKEVKKLKFYLKSMKGERQ